MKRSMDNHSFWISRKNRSNSAIKVSKLTAIGWKLDYVLINLTPHSKSNLSANPALLSEQECFLRVLVCILKRSSIWRTHPMQLLLWWNDGSHPVPMVKETILGDTPFSERCTHETKQYQTKNYKASQYFFKDISANQKSLFSLFLAVCFVVMGMTADYNPVVGNGKSLIVEMSWKNYSKSQAYLSLNGVFLTVVSSTVYIDLWDVTISRSFYPWVLFTFLFCSLFHFSFPSPDSSLRLCERNRIFF